MTRRSTVSRFRGASLLLLFFAPALHQREAAGVLRNVPPCVPISSVEDGLCCRFTSTSILFFFLIAFFFGYDEYCTRVQFTRYSTVLVWLCGLQLAGSLHAAVLVVFEILTKAIVRLQIILNQNDSAYVKAPPVAPTTKFGCAPKAKPPRAESPRSKKSNHREGALTREGTSPACACARVRKVYLRLYPALSPTRFFFEFVVLYKNSLPSKVRVVCIPLVR